MSTSSSPTPSTLVRWSDDNHCTQHKAAGQISQSYIPECLDLAMCSSIANKGEYDTLVAVDEGRKRVLLIAAAILAVRKLAQYDSGARVPATVAAIADGVRWAERIMEEIDRRHPEKPAQQRRAS